MAITSIGNQIGFHAQDLSLSARETKKQSVSRKFTLPEEKVKENSKAAGKSLPIEAYRVPGWLYNWSNSRTSHDLIRIEELELGVPSRPMKKLSSEARAFNEMKRAHFSRALRENGIHSDQEYFEAINNEKMSRELHETMKENMLKDKCMIELLNRFNIEIEQSWSDDSF